MSSDNLKPLLPLRDIVIFPSTVIPLFVGREKSIKALDKAMEGNKQILLIAQKSPTDDDPGENETYDVGTMANILQLLKLPDCTINGLVEGTSRASVSNYKETDGMCVADAQLLEASVADEYGKKAAYWEDFSTTQFHKYWKAATYIYEEEEKNDTNESNETKSVNN